MSVELVVDADHIDVVKERAAHPVAFGGVQFEVPQFGFQFVQEFHSSRGLDLGQFVVCTQLGLGFACQLHLRGKEELFQNT